MSTILQNNNGFAKIIQILHTNDLHSYFEGTRGGIGGYAQLKTVVTKLKQEALEKGIPTLYLDGGDFGEGSSYYFSNQGVDSLRALDMLGVDVTVLGNHDFILGGPELKKQIIESGVKTKILSANLKGKILLGLKGRVPNHIDYEFEGKKVRIFGLTTNEIHYMYPLRPLARIASPHKIGMEEARKSKKDGIDFTIALTHIGLSKDIKLVEKSRSIDLVVGGHTHILLGKPELIKNLEGRNIPILQAGAHSGHIGSMLVDIKGGHEAELIDYKMIDISRTMPQEEQMQDFTKKAYSNRDRYFGRSWSEVIGHSKIPLTGNFNGQSTTSRSCWSQHIARLTRQTADAELGLQFDVFQGEQIQPGPITFGDMIDNFPHFRKWGDKGWKISRARVSGFLLRKILDLMANSEVSLQVTIDGLKTKNTTNKGLLPYNPKINKAHDAVLNGHEISNLKFYTIALPSEIPYGVFKLVHGITYAFLHEVETIEDSDYWVILENYIRKNSPLECLPN